MSADGTRARAPEATRGRILEAAFHEMYAHGFQGASLSAILARAGVTKGALYHHFTDKTALGHAVVEEVIREPILDAYLGPLSSDVDDPLTALQGALRRRADDFDDIGIRFGCPLNNLTQEMAAVEDGFRARVTDMLRAWADGIADALRRGQARGSVRPDVDADRVAAFTVASTEGAFGMAKAADSVDVLRSNLEVLADFLETLRPAA